MITQKDRQTKKLFIIFMMKRKTSLSPNHFCLLNKCMVVDDIGFFIDYEPKQRKLLTIETARRLLMFKEQFTDVVIAKDRVEALRIIERRYKKPLRMGGNDDPRQKAIWILPDKTQELPICPYLHITRYGLFVCGDIVRSRTGLFGECWLEGADKPEFCPIKSDKKDVYYFQIKEL